VGRRLAQSGFFFFWVTAKRRQTGAASKGTGPRSRPRPETRVRQPDGTAHDGGAARVPRFPKSKAGLVVHVGRFNGPLCLHDVPCSALKKRPSATRAPGLLWAGCGVAGRPDHHRRPIPRQSFPQRHDWARCRRLSPHACGSGAGSDNQQPANRRGAEKERRSDSESSAPSPLTTARGVRRWQAARTTNADARRIDARDDWSVPR